MSMHAYVCGKTVWAT